MIGSYWPLLVTLAGIFGLVDQPKLAWACLLIAGLLSLLG